MSGMNDFAPFLKKNGCFIVRNICKDPKRTIRIFQYPINNGEARDLLQIPGVSESDIRSSLLKGELKQRMDFEEIVVECSDIDLLQFNAFQKAYLQSHGIVNGLDITDDNLAILRKEDIQLLGIVDNSNQIFTIPSGTFIQDATHKIIVYKNGVKQVFTDDYFIAESGGPGTGYDTIILTVPPTTVPAPDDIITADYYIDNS